MKIDLDYKGTEPYYLQYHKYLLISEKLDNSKIKDLALELRGLCEKVDLLIEEKLERKRKIKLDWNHSPDLSRISEAGYMEDFIREEKERLDFIKKDESNLELNYAFDNLRTTSSKIKRKVKKEVGKQDIISLTGYYI